MFWEFCWQWELKWAEWGAGTEQSTPGEALVAMGPGRWCALVPVSELSTPSGSSWSGDESNHLPCKELSFLSRGADLGLCLNSTALSVGHMLCKKRYSEERAAWKAGICELWGATSRVWGACDDGGEPCHEVPSLEPPCLVMHALTGAWTQQSGPFWLHLTENPEP